MFDRLTWSLRIMSWFLIGLRTRDRKPWSDHNVVGMNDFKEK
ncbi:MAG: hypothetical protein QW254_01480 [Desulfurococcaceae archaeon]